MSLQPKPKQNKTKGMQKILVSSVNRKNKILTVLSAQPSSVFWEKKNVDLLRMIATIQLLS